MPQQSPVPDEIDAPFWEACNGNKMVIQFCNNCDKYRFPPAAECWVCASGPLEWRPVVAAGVLYSYAVIHDTPISTLKLDLPYVVGVIELDDADGVNLVAHLRDVALDHIPMDAPVRISFEATPGTGQRVPIGRIVEANKQ